MQITSLNVPNFNALSLRILGGKKKEKKKSAIQNTFLKFISSRREARQIPSLSNLCLSRTDKGRRFKSGQIFKTSGSVKSENRKTSRALAFAGQIINCVWKNEARFSNVRILVLFVDRRFLRLTIPKKWVMSFQI